MLLSDRDIRAQIDANRIVLEPFQPDMVQPASIDVRLDRYFRLFDNHKYSVIDPAADQAELTRLIDVGSDEPFVLHPGEFVLGSTYEHVTLPDDVAARLEGKSSLGRLGLLTHSTAGFVDPGFSGHVTLELSNTATMPILLWPGMKIGQLCFFQLSSAAEHPYGDDAAGSRYQGQEGPTASRSFQNFTRIRITRESTLAELAAGESSADSASAESERPEQDVSGQLTPSGTPAPRWKPEPPAKPRVNPDAAPIRIPGMRGTIF